MKTLCLLIVGVLLLHACQTSSQKSKPVLLTDTRHYAYPVKQHTQWTTNPDEHNAAVALSALKAYELSDTAQLCKYMADTITVYYNGGTYKGNNHEFMYAIKANVKHFKNLHLEVNDFKSEISSYLQQERVLIWHTQYITNVKSLPDSADVFNDARLKDGKIIAWYIYMRRYNR